MYVSLLMGSRPPTPDFRCFCLELPSILSRDIKYLPDAATIPQFIYLWFMLTISQRGIQMPASPIRKLVPFAEAAKKRGTKVYHLNIGQPDIETPKMALDAVRNF